MKKSYFFVIDGVDGSGKSTILKGVHNHLFSFDKRFRILTSREPTMGTYGKRIREMLKNDTDPRENAEQMLDLFIKDRKEHQDILRRFLKNVKEDDVNIVLCDRYYYSTIAFQSAQGLDVRDIISKNSSFLKPDCTFILDLDPQVALERMQTRKKEKFEQLEFMQRLRKQFLLLPKLLNEDIVIIDASKDRAIVLKQAIKKIDSILNAASYIKTGSTAKRWQPR